MSHWPYAGDRAQPVCERRSAPSYSARMDGAANQLCWGDERSVPPENPRCSYVMVREILLGSAPVPVGNVHCAHGEDDPQCAARDYAVAHEIEETSAGSIL